MEAYIGGSYNLGPPISGTGIHSLDWRLQSGPTVLEPTDLPSGLEPAVWRPCSPADCMPASLGCLACQRLLPPVCLGRLARLPVPVCLPICLPWLHARLTTCLPARLGWLAGWLVPACYLPTCLPALVCCRKGNIVWLTDNVGLYTIR